jgi:hypothetical protein
MKASIKAALFHATLPLRNRRMGAAKSVTDSQFELLMVSDLKLADLVGTWKRK